MRLIPTILAHNKEEFNQQFQKILPISKNIQIDFMDGKFVRTKSVSLSQIPNLRKYKNNFEAHLMVSSLKKWIKKLKQKGFKKVIIHCESLNVKDTIAEAKKQKLTIYLAINSETPLAKILPLLSEISGVLFLGVNPGKSGQKFIPSVLKKIRKLRRINKTIRIQVDGGVNEKTILQIRKAGADDFNVGSFISASQKPKEQFKKLNSLIKSK